MLLYSVSPQCGAINDLIATGIANQASIALDYMSARSVDNQVCKHTPRWILLYVFRILAVCLLEQLSLMNW